MHVHVHKIVAARHYQRKSDPTRVLVDKSRTSVKRDLSAALDHLGDSMDIDRANYLARNGRWRELPDAVNYGHFNEVLKAPFNRLGDVATDAAQIGARKVNGAFNQRHTRVQFAKPLFNFQKDVSGQFSYDRFSPKTQAKLRDYQDKFILGLSEESRATIAAVIVYGQRMGLPPEAIVDSIKRTVGLTTRQAQAVMNYRAMISRLDPQALQRQLAEGDDTDKLRQAIADGTPLSEALIDEMTARYEDNYLDYRAGVIAQTESTRAASVGLQDSYEQMTDRGVLPTAAVTRNWLLDLDEKTCPICISIVDMNPDGVGLNEPFQSVIGPVQLPVDDTHVGCVVGDTLVAARGISAGFIREFQGDVVIICTASGKNLTCTPNHPILTPRGWIGAGLLDVGDHVICSLFSDGVSIGDVNYEDMPVSIEKITDALGIFGQMTPMPMPISAEDFHGDGGASEIAIIYANRLLRNGHKTSLQKKSVKDLFRSAVMFGKRHFSFRPSDFFGRRSYATLRGLMSGLGLSESFLANHSRPFERFAFALAPDMDAPFNQAPSNDRTRYAIFFRDFFFGKMPVRLSDFLGRQRLPNTAHLDASRIEGLDDVRSTYAELAANLLAGHAGLVETDRIVKIDRVKFSGHVYNLETSGGWYVANGIITHNCRCSIEYHTNLDMLNDEAAMDAAAQQFVEKKAEREIAP